MNTERTMRQIDKIKRKLGSRELFLLWLRNAPPFDSEKDCAAWIVDQVEEGSDKISLLAGEVASALRIPLVGHTWRYGDAMVARAQGEVYSLYFLYIGVNVYVVAQAVAYLERCPNLNCELPRTLELGELLLKLREVLSPVDGATAPPAGPAAEAEIRRSVVLWKAQLADLTKKVQSLRSIIAETQVVVDVINRSYFDGHLVLWQDASRFLDLSRSELNALKIVEERLRAADEFATAAGLGSPDTPNVHHTLREVEAQARRTVARLVLMAKVDALRRMGKREEARELLMDHIKKEENCEAEAEALLGLESPGGPRT